MGVGSLGQPEVSPNTQYKKGHHPVSLWPQDLAKVLAAPPDGVSCLQFHHLSSNPPSLQRSMTNFEYKFGLHSPPLSMIHSLPQLEGKTQFFSMDQKVATALCLLTFQLYLTTCIFLHLFHSPSLCAVVNVFLSSGMPFPHISLDSYYSQYKLLGYHHYQQDSQDPFVRTRCLFSLFLYYLRILL